MSDTQARGYILASTASYLREAAGQARAEAVLQTASPELQEALRNVQPAGWYPTRLFAELNRTVANTLAGSDEEKARQVLIDCGRHMGREAANTFLKLLMKLLTPKLIVNKYPTFWSRDFTNGRIEVAVNDNTLVFKISDFPNHDHICPISAGWIGFNLEMMGKTLEKTVVKKWSLAAPCEDGTSFELTWRA